MEDDFHTETGDVMWISAIQYLLPFLAVCVELAIVD